MFARPAKFSGALIRVSDGDSGALFQGNLFHVPGGSVGMNNAGKVQQVRFVDPTRTAATWHRKLGKEGTREAFLAEAHKQSKHNWRPEYTAKAVIAYIREGFRPARQ